MRLRLRHFMPEQDRRAGSEPGVGKGEQRSYRRELLVTDAGLCWEVMYRCSRPYVSQSIVQEPSDPSEAVGVLRHCLVCFHPINCQKTLSPGDGTNKGLGLQPWLSLSAFLRQGPYFTLELRRSTRLDLVFCSLTIF